MDGIAIINKPKGCTSQDVVTKVKKILNVKKVGHAGTLDPIATGVLVVLIGKGTKLSEKLMQHDKSYAATLKLGIATETGDTEGKTVETKEVNLDVMNENKIKAALNKFLGKQMQTPPIYSAIKVNGKKLYEYARKGETVEIKAREIEIFDIKLNSINKENLEINFEVSCSKGTYIRTLCEDIAKDLGTLGCLSGLVRTRVGEFEISKSVTLENLNENSVIFI
jgi:tRNA pseudouridine55 synthase